MKRTITAANGKKVEIKEGERYCVAYRTKGWNGEWYDAVDFGAYLNYQQDQYIGHDDCEGCSNGPRFYFDEATEETGPARTIAKPTYKIVSVMPIAEAFARLQK